MYAVGVMVRHERSAVAAQNRSTVADVCGLKSEEDVQIEQVDDLMDWTTKEEGVVLSCSSIGAIFGSFFSIWIYDLFFLRVVFPLALFMAALNSLVLPFMAVAGELNSTIINRFFTGFYTGIMVRSCNYK